MLRKRKKILFVSATSNGAALLASGLLGRLAPSLDTRCAFIDDGCLNADALYVLAEYDISFDPANTPKVTADHYDWADILVQVGQHDGELSFQHQGLPVFAWFDLDFSWTFQGVTGWRKSVEQLTDRLREFSEEYMRVGT